MVLPGPTPHRGLLGSLSFLAGLAFPCGAQERAPAADPVPRELQDEGYAGSEACRECHGRNHETWHASFHRTMTQGTQAIPGAAVLAPLATWSGTTPVLEGTAWKLERAQGEYLVTPVSRGGLEVGPRGRVALTTGSHHYQIYWFAVEGAAELQQLPLVWHVAERAWVPRKAMFLVPPGPTGDETGRWPQVCIKCHTTNATPRRADTGETSVAQLGVACEACHGPGAAHVELRRERAGREDGDEDADDATIANPGELDHVRSSQVCGQCHGIHPLADRSARELWEREGFAFRPGDDLAATRTLLRGRHADNGPALRAFLDRNQGTLQELYWPDGEVRVSGREYNGLFESACFQRGEMSCISCHELHPAKSDPRPLASWACDQLAHGMDGPAACLQCHGQYGEPDALAAHTHHARGSSGSDCLNCHMPYTAYGLTKAIRSHTINSPSAAAALATGRPNACNQCHLDRSLGWTADRLQEWYGHERPALSADQETTAAAVLWALAGDAGQRALVAWNLGWEPAREVSGTGWMPPLFSTLLMDSYDAVRWIAVRSVRLEPRYRGFALDFCAELEEQRNAVRESVLSDWLRAGLGATPGQRDAVLVRPDGTLDEPRFRRLYAARDERPVRLAE